MKVGLFINTQYPEQVDVPAQIPALVEQVRVARDAGFKSLWFPHHWLTEPMQMLQIMPAMAFLAAEAKGMVIGPEHSHPAVAEPDARRRGSRHAGRSDRWQLRAGRRAGISATGVLRVRHSAGRTRRALLGKHHPDAQALGRREDHPRGKILHRPRCGYQFEADARRADRRSISPASSTPPFAAPLGLATRG